MGMFNKWSVNDFENIILTDVSPMFSPFWPVACVPDASPRRFFAKTRDR